MSDTSFLSLFPASVQVSDRALVVTEAASEADLEAVESLLLTANASFPFAWGDLLNHYAKTRGEEYAAMKAHGKYAPGTSRNIQWVCRQVDVSRRRDTLDFGHHTEVAKLTPTEQELMLTKAEEEGLSVPALRAAVRKSQQTITTGEEDKPIDAAAARASRAWHEFWPWFQAQYPTMPDAQKKAWQDNIEPLIGMVLPCVGVSSQQA